MPTIDELLRARQAKAQVSATPPQVPSGGTGTACAPLPPYAKLLEEDLRKMASEEDYADVELSAQSLAETMNAVMHIPYPPDIFIDQCVEYAAQALDNQKRVYMQRVMSGEKQSGKRDRQKAVAVAMKVDNLDNLFD